MKKFLITIIIILILVIVVTVTYGVYKVFRQEAEIIDNEVEKIPEIVEEPEPETVKIVSGNSRPIAVMIDNVGSARP